MIHKEVLDNGLTVVTEETGQFRSVSLGVWLKTGSRHEPAMLNGISHFIEHLVFKGTQKRSAREIALIIDSIGGQVDAFTAKEYTCFYTKVLDEHLTVAVDLLSDIVLRPRFDQQDIEKERRVILEEIRMVEDSPDELVYDVFSEHYWKGHPMGRPIQGTERTVSRLTASRLAGHFSGSYKPENIVIAAAGNIRHRSFVRSMRRAFEPLTPGAVNGRVTMPRSYPVFVRREKKELEQIHLCVGLPALAMGSRQRYALLVLNTVLGGTMSSRLWQRIREGSGLAYSVYSAVNSYRDCGFIMVYAATNPAAADTVVQQVCEEFARLKKEPVGEKDLRVAKDHLKGAIMLSLESTSSRMSNLARQEIYFGKQFSMDEVLREIENVSAGQVRALARKLLVAERSGLAVVGRLARFKARRPDLEF